MLPLTKPIDSEQSVIKITPIILCGGSGTRLWPLSRSLYPKQFCSLVGNTSLFQQTLQRVQNVDLFAKPFVVANQQHQFLVEKEVKAANLECNILLEPCVKNTTPAITLAALAIAKKNPKEILLVMPSDHLIEPVDEFLKTVQEALPAALAGNLMTFGIQPNRPETGYGYIQYQADDAEIAKSVHRFVEKPDEKTAAEYLNQGNFLWNSGILLFQAQTFLKAVADYEPQVLSVCERAVLTPSLQSVWHIDEAVFSQSPSISVDYGIMERAPNVKVVPLTVNWSDLGSWQALWEVNQHNNEGNTVVGDVVTHNVHHSYIRSESRLVTVVGLDDVIVVDSQDAVLVASRSAAQDVKKIVETLQLSERRHIQSHPTEERPWGSFQSIDRGERFHVKRITVQPGQKLSLQMHHHRAEHWIVVRGTAKVTRDQEELMVFENQSVYIPCGTKHRLENPGKIPLELIEVQSGPYLGEDDILRFGDDYGRA